MAINQQALATVKNAMTKRIKDFQALATGLVPAEKVINMALMAMTKNPSLLECDEQSLIRCAYACTTLGLDPSGLLGECYIIPYKKVATLQVGYQGLRELVGRTGKVEMVYSNVVYERDKFEVKEGTERTLIHEPCGQEDPGKIIATYAVAVFPSGKMQFEVVYEWEMKKQIIARSQNPKMYDDNPREMRKKAAVKRLCKYLPKSVELRKAIDIDTAAEIGESQANIIDIECEETETKTDTVKEKVKQQLSNGMTEEEKLRARQREAREAQ